MLFSNSSVRRVCACLYGALRWRRESEFGAVDILVFVKKGQISDRHTMGHLRHPELIHVEQAIWYCESSIPRRSIVRGVCKSLFYDAFRVKSSITSIR